MNCNKIRRGIGQDAENSGIDVSTQLALFSVPRNRSLIETNASSTRSGESSGRSGNRSRIIYPMTLVIFGAILIGFGIWHCLLGFGTKSPARFALSFGIFAFGFVWTAISVFYFCIVFAENVSAAPGIDASAARYSRTKYIDVLSIVIAELKFRDVQRHVFGADLVERADHAALNQRPETLNRMRMDGTDNVFLCSVAHDAVRIVFAEFVIGPQVIGCEQADFVRNGFPNEADERVAVETLKDAGDDIAFALYRPDNADLPDRAASATAALIPVFVFVFPADVGFIYFDNTGEPIRLVFARPARMRLHM